MRRGLTLDDLGDLLELPLIAVLGTTRTDGGGILLAPVWQEWRGGAFSMFAPVNDAKVRNLRADPRASVVVYESVPPYRGVEVRGTASLITEGAAETAERIAARYEEPDPEDPSVPDECVIIRVEPGTVRAWDFVDEF